MAMASRQHATSAREESLQGHGGEEGRERGGVRGHLRLSAAGRSWTPCSASAHPHIVRMLVLEFAPNCPIPFIASPRLAVLFWMLRRSQPATRAR
jgi:hypothetical protein